MQLWLRWVIPSSLPLFIRLLPKLTETQWHDGQSPTSALQGKSYPMDVFFLWIIEGTTTSQDTDTKHCRGNETAWASWTKGDSPNTTELLSLFMDICVFFCNLSVSLCTCLFLIGEHVEVGTWMEREVWFPSYNKICLQMSRGETVPLG